MAIGGGKEEEEAIYFCQQRKDDDRRKKEEEEEEEEGKMKKSGGRKKKDEDEKEEGWMKWMRGRVWRKWGRRMVARERKKVPSSSASSASLPFPVLCLALFAALHLYLLTLSALRVSSAPFRLSSPSLLFLLSLLALYALFATGSAISACATRSPPLPHRLRPLLFITTVLSLLGLPALWFLPWLCHLPHLLPLPLPSFISLHFCPSFSPLSSPSFSSLLLSLLLSTLVPLRPLLLHQLALLRLLRVHLQLGHGLGQKFTNFNLFCEKMEKTTDPEQRALFEEWSTEFREKMDKKNEEPEKELNLEESRGRGPKKPILKKTGTNRAKLTQKDGVQFSELVLIRDLGSVHNEVGQLVHLGRRQKLVLERMYADFVRDFRVKMGRNGRIVPKSARQIVCRFATERQQQNLASKLSGMRARGRRGRTGEGKDDYESIDGDGERGKTRNRTATASMILRQSPRPRLPTTPVPRSTPASLLASPSTPLQDTLPGMPGTDRPAGVVYENIPAQQQNHQLGWLTQPTLLEDKWRKKKPIPTPRRPKPSAKTGKTTPACRERCWCPLGARCQANGGRVQYYVLSPEGEGMRMIGGGGKDEEDEEEEAEGEETEDD